MTRRNGTGPKVVAAAVLLLLVIYAIYAHNDVQNKLRTSEEKTERLRQQYDSLSAQLQGMHLSHPQAEPMNQCDLTLRIPRNSLIK